MAIALWRAPLLGRKVHHHLPYIIDRSDAVPVVPVVPSTLQHRVLTMVTEPRVFIPPRRPCLTTHAKSSTALAPISPQSVASLNRLSSSSRLGSVHLETHDLTHLQPVKRWNNRDLLGSAVPPHSISFSSHGNCAPPPPGRVTDTPRSLKHLYRLLTLG
jgi:hypothetical protein